MPGTNYTTNLRLANPSLNDTGWGTTVSSGMIDLTDQAIAGLATANVTSSDVTLTIVDGSAGVNSARNMFLDITGTPGVARDVIVPTNRKLYFVTNNCGQIATVKVSGQPGVAIPVGATMALRINAAGTDVAPAFTYAASLSLGTALPATSGGTGQSSFAVGDLLYASTTTAISKLTVGATNAVLTVAAGIPSWVTTLGVASGGTGAATLAANNVLLGNGTSAVQVVAPGTAGNVLTSAGGTWTSAAPAAGYVGPSIQVFTSNGTFNVPPGITKVKATVVGGGGPGGNFTSGGSGEGAAGGGGGGAVAVKWVTVTALGSYSVTVGGSGASSVFDSITSAGGSTGGTGSLGVFAAGGAGGAVTDTSSWPGFTSSGSAGAAGVSNGSVGVGGAGGISGATSFGDQFRWGSGAASNTSGTNATAGSAGSTYGGGGSGAARGTGSGGASGGAGATGVVIFEW